MKEKKEIINIETKNNLFGLVYLNNNFNEENILLSNILENDYLQNEIRIKNGAYGYKSFVDINNNFYLFSFCDPNIKNSKKVFLNINNYLKKLSVSKIELKNYKISTINNLIKPNHINKSFDNFINNYLENINGEKINEIIDGIIKIDRVSSLRIKISENNSREIYLGDKNGFLL